MASGSENRTAGLGTVPASHQAYKLPALDIASGEWKRISGDIANDAPNPDESAESPSPQNAQNEIPKSHGDKQDDTELATPQTELPSPAEPISGTELTRFRPEHFPRPYHDAQERDIMSRGFFERQHQFNVPCRAPPPSSRDPQGWIPPPLLHQCHPHTLLKGAPHFPYFDYSVYARDRPEPEEYSQSTHGDSFASNEPNTSPDTPFTDMSDFHKQVYRSLSKHVAGNQRGTKIDMNEPGSSPGSPSTGLEIRKDSKCFEKSLPSHHYTNRTLHGPEAQSSHISGPVDGRTLYTLKNVPLSYPESHCEQGTLKPMHQQQHQGQQSFYYPYGFEEATSSVNLAGGSKPRIVHNHSPSNSRPSQRSHCESSPAANPGQAGATYKQNLSASGGKGGGPPKLVPYGTGTVPIDLFKYDSTKSPRPTIYRAKDSSSSINGYEPKKFTSKGVATHGALGVPLYLLSRKKLVGASSESIVDSRGQQVKGSNESPSPGSGANEGGTTLPEETPENSSGVMAEEPGTTPPTPLQRAVPLTQKSKRENSLRKFIGKLARKSSETGKENSDPDSTLAKPSSHYPHEDTESKKTSSLIGKFSSKMSFKNNQESQAHVHPALRTSGYFATSDRTEPTGNGNADLRAVPNGDTTGRPWKGKNVADR